ncbi:RRP15-like protein [Diabrotica virgifera virgifera]|uniref:RRP15-like protein n=1 Tax=Diabrotica virgifera virgifera TaxID=50390 RepID=A0A6P7FYE4_DIAVI|nr:RRP15-like protein [Diabrotica virgifera virgifera]
MTIMDSTKAQELEDDLSDDNVSEESDHGDSNNSEDEDNDLANTGWADAISKILKQKPKAKSKSVVLSKAKKLTDVKKAKKEPLSFEIAGEDGAAPVKEEDEEQSEDVKSEVLEPVRKKKKEIPKLRVKPNILEKDRERLLQKIATKGVVQLFNAVKSQQKDITKKLEEAGPLEVRKERVLKNIDKRAFLDVLMGEKSQKLDTNMDVVEKKEEKRLSKKNASNDVTWSVLKEDFMMGAKMKDWDKELETEEVEELESD